MHRVPVQKTKMHSNTTTTTVAAPVTPPTSSTLLMLEGSVGGVGGFLEGDGSPGEVMEGVLGDGSPGEVMEGVIGDGSACEVIGSVVLVRSLPDGRMGLEDGSALGLMTKEMSSATALTELLRGVAVVWPVNKEEEVGAVVGGVVGAATGDVKSDTLCDREVENAGELPLVGLSPSKRVVSIDTAVGLVPPLESTRRKRLGVGARDPVDRSSDDVASGSKL